MNLHKLVDLIAEVAAKRIAREGKSKEAAPDAVYAIIARHSSTPRGFGEVFSLFTCGTWQHLSNVLARWSYK